jgi:hypothetical protein
MANQEPGRYPPLDFSPDPRRRIGVALLITGLGVLLVLMIAFYIVVANWWYAARGTETFDYWFDIVAVGAFTLGTVTASVGLHLIGASRIKPQK